MQRFYSRTNSFVQGLFMIFVVNKVDKLLVLFFKKIILYFKIPKIKSPGKIHPSSLNVREALNGPAISV